MKISAKKVWLFGGAAVLAVVNATAAFAQTRSFNVPAEEAVKAIPEFARQAGVQIVASADQLGGVKTSGVSGSLDVHVALRQLLAGTGIEVSSDDGQTIVLKSAPKNVQAASNEAARETTVETVVVTGTAIRGVVPAGSPLTVFDTQAIERTGAATVGEFLKSVPQNFASVDGDNGTLSFNADASSAVAGSSSINLRGLGPGATLVLVNGHRFAAAGFAGSFADVSVIPLAAIDRVEMLTDGASSIYGADAVAGVVNFVLKKDFDGEQASFRYGAATQGGANEVTGSAAIGRTWAGGSAMLSYEYYDQDPYFVRQRTLPDNTIGSSGNLGLGPSQHRNSIYFTAQQDIDSDTNIGIDILFGRRGFSYSVAQVSETAEATGGSENYGGSLQLVRNFGGGWQGSIVGDTGRVTDNSLSLVNISGTQLAPSLVHEASQTSGVTFKADGPLFAIRSGDVRLSIGGSIRHDNFSGASNSATPKPVARDSESAFAELAIPVISNSDGQFLKSMSLSASARFDNYSDFGSALSPKVGVTAVPVDGLALRSSYSASFRAPPLEQLGTAGSSYLVFRVSDPAAAGGTMNTLYNLSAGNPNLRPETSHTFTAGADITPSLVPGLTVSGTYFRIGYNNRIARPTLPAGLFGLFTDPATAAAASASLQVPPNPALVSAAYASTPFSNPFGIAAGNVGAYFDDRFQNIASSLTEGIDLSTNYQIDAFGGKLNPFASFTYLIRSEARSAPSAAAVSQINVVGQPVGFKGRAGSTYQWDIYSVTGTVNYVDGYTNSLLLVSGKPAGSVGSWTTFDLQGTLTVPESAPEGIAGMQVSLNVQNLFDQAPPGINAGTISFVGYDATNASALGRFISVQFRKTW